MSGYLCEIMFLCGKETTMNNKKSDLQMQVVNRIKKIRLSHNISQRDMANILDITSGEIGNIESLKYKNKYTLKQLMTISTKMQVSIVDLLYNEDEKDGKKDVDEILKRIVSYLD